MHAVLWCTASACTSDLQLRMPDTGQRALAHARLTNTASDKVVVCRNNREAMDKIVDELLVQETIRGEDFRKTLSKYSNIPEENLVGEVKDSQMAVA